MSDLNDTITLNDGNAIPSLGVGLYKVAPDKVEALVEGALGQGYRLFDTATMYGNEAALGEAIESSNVPRGQVFITTKVLNIDQGYTSTRDACRRSIELLRTDFVDLYLIHWPAPRQGHYVETWDALQSLKQDGLVRSIGVSNFNPQHLDRLATQGGAVPVINQIECHPWLPQNKLREIHGTRGIATQAWSPLARGRILVHSTLVEIAEKHDTTTAEVALSWQLQRGVAVIAKTLRLDHLAQNARAFDLDLSGSDIARIDEMETGERTGSNPEERD